MLTIFPWNNCAQSFCILQRVETRDKERFPDSWKAAKEKPCTIHNGGNNIAVKLTEIQDGWELDKTEAIQVTMI